MALYKRNVRGKLIYYSDITLNGRRYQRSLRTNDWRQATQREKDLVARVTEGKVTSAKSGTLARAHFAVALDRFLAERMVELQIRGPDPRKSWEGRLTEPLRLFFAGKRLCDIEAEDVRRYQAHRLGAGKHAHTINHEVKGLFRLLKRARLLSRIRDEVKLLPRLKTHREMLTPAEKQRLFETAASHSDWQTAYCAGLLTANTTMRPCELKRLKWSDLDPEARTLTVWRSKTEAGTRAIPLNDEAWSAIAALKQRADALAVYAPEHYVFHRLRPLDPVRPVTEWKTAWRSLCRAAAQKDEERGCEEMPRLAKLRFYNLRHQCVTEMLEAGVPEGVIREIAGHIDPEMTRLYSHPRLAIRRAAVHAISSGTKTALSRPSSQGGYVTQTVTQALPEAVKVS